MEPVEASDLEVAGRLASPVVERRFEEEVVEAAEVRIAVVADLAEGVVPVVDVLEDGVEVLAPVVPLAAAAGLRRAPAVPAFPVVVLFSAVLPGLDMRVLVLLAAVVVKVGLRSSSLALTLGRLR